MSLLQKIGSEIKDHYQNHGSPVKESQLLAVSKLQSIEKIEELYQQGQRRFAENYVQEALLKKSQLKHLDIEWHLIGHLQKNKINQILGQFHLIHSVDSLELAQILSKKCIEKNLRQKILLQVNVGQETSKQGFSEAEVLQQMPELRGLQGLEIQGLMTMPPLELEPEQARSHFRRLRELRDQLAVVELSMGTSHDFKVALEEGSTMVRLGTVLFGQRPAKG